MSYDLMVFDPDYAPKKSEIAGWYMDAMDEDERDTRLIDDPASTQSGRLQAFYADMRQMFPAMNGPDAVSDDVESNRVTGYAFYPGFIYMDFRWSAAEPASITVPTLAEKHGLGLFDPQHPNDGLMSMGKATRPSS